MFYSFSSQEERRRCGGTCFIEISFCKLPRTAKEKQLVAINNIKHWSLDSLYISADDADAFLTEYGDIFVSGMYHSLETGKIDIYGINYYSPELASRIAAEVSKSKPAECEKLLQWLKKAEVYNGFYILGV